MTVVFEVRSPKNTRKEMEEKRLFYEHYGVEEYYLYDPDKNTLNVWIRRGTAFTQAARFKTFTSPRLGIRFDLIGPEMVVYYPDGKPFLTFEELKAAQEKTEQLLARVLELSRKARHGQATTDELAELDQLEGSA